MASVRRVREQRSAVRAHRRVVVMLVVRFVIVTVTVPMMVVMGIRFVRAALLMERVFDPVHAFMPRA